MNLDLTNIAEKLIIMLLGGLGTWVLTSVRELRSDVDAAFRKIRNLEKELFDDDAGTDAGAK